MRAARLAVTLALAACVACAGPDRGRAYVAAYAAGEAAFGTAKFADAAADFDEAARTAKIHRDADHARYLAARALARAGDHAGAATRLQAIADSSPPLEDSAEAANAIAEMQIARADEAGWQALLDVARRFPSSGIARPALRRYVAHEDEAAGPQGSLAFLEKISPTFDRTELEETVAYEIALHLAALGQDLRARDAFLAMTRRWTYVNGVYWDDGLARASALDEKLGDYAGATSLLDQMLAERTSSWMLGTYERPRYEPALVHLCALARDHFRDLVRARACFDRVYRELTTSELRDDALWEEARLYREGGDQPGACTRLAALANDFPDSRYIPCAIATCPSVRRPAKSHAPLECHPYINALRLGVDDAGNENATNGTARTATAPTK
jgi:hypothetical protein